MNFTFHFVKIIKFRVYWMFLYLIKLLVLYFWKYYKNCSFNLKFKYKCLVIINWRNFRVLIMENTHIYTMNLNTNQDRDSVLTRPTRGPLEPGEHTWMWNSALLEEQQTNYNQMRFPMAINCLYRLLSTYIKVLKKWNKLFLRSYTLKNGLSDMLVQVYTVHLEAILFIQMKKSVLLTVW